MKSKAIPLTLLLCLGCFYSTLVGCGTPTDPPKTTELASNTQQLGSGYPNQTDSLIDELSTTETRSAQVHAQFKALNKIVEDAQEAANNADDAADYVIDLHKLTKDAILLVGTFTAIPAPVGAVAKTLKTTLKNFKTTLDGPKATAENAKSKIKKFNTLLTHLKKNVLTPILDVLDKLNKSATSHREQLRFLKNCIDDMSSPAAAKTSMETHANLHINTVKAINTALAAVTINNYNLDVSLPDLTNLLTLPSGLLSTLKQIDNLLKPLQSFFDELNIVLDTKITIDFELVEYSFKVRKILDGLDIIQGAIDLLLDKALKLLEPVLDKLGINIPSIPGLSNFTGILDDFMNFPDLENPLNNITVDFEGFLTQFNGLYTDLRGLFSLTIGNFCDEDWNRVSQLKVNGLCLSAASLSDGSNVIVDNCDKSKKARRWAYRPYKLQLKIPGKNFCAQAGGTGTGSQVRVKPCDKNKTLQQWIYEPGANILRLSGTQNCIQAVNSSAGENVKLKSCDSNLNTQSNTLKPFDPDNQLYEPAKRFKLQDGGKCLRWKTITVDVVFQVKSIQIDTCDNVNNRKWRYSPLTGALCTASKAVGKSCIARNFDITTKDESPLKLYECSIFCQSVSLHQPFFFSQSGRWTGVRQYPEDPNDPNAGSWRMNVASSQTSTNGATVRYSKQGSSNASWDVVE